MTRTAEATVPGTAYTPKQHGLLIERAAGRQVQTFPAIPESVGFARLFVKFCLHEWGYEYIADNAVLVVSELVTNAVRASSVLGGALRNLHVALSIHRRHVLIAVADASPKFPLNMHDGNCAENGRGLWLVDAFADDWGWHEVNGSPGVVKVVWAYWNTEQR